jgi:hypothetical protein
MWESPHTVDCIPSPLTYVTVNGLPVSSYLAADIDAMLVHVGSFCALTFVTVDGLPASSYLAAYVAAMLVHVGSLCPFLYPLIFISVHL